MTHFNLATMTLYEAKNFVKSFDDNYEAREWLQHYLNYQRYVIRRLDGCKTYQDVKDKLMIIFEEGWSKRVILDAIIYLGFHKKFRGVKRFLSTL